MRLRGLLLVVAMVGFSLPASATHVPLALDTPASWSCPVGFTCGYLDFMEPAAFIPILPVPGDPGVPIAPGGIFTEEHTGFTTIPGADIVDPLGPPVDPFGPDTHTFAGDVADFDWNQEHRPDETLAALGGSHHTAAGTPVTGAMGWDITAILPSPHANVVTGPHGHSLAELIPGGLPELVLPDLLATGFDHFNFVDVFSVISTGEDTDAGGPREAALDYDIWFVDLIAGVSTPGVPVTVFVPGWTALTPIDDFVTRWAPADPTGHGFWNAIAIEPATGLGHDDITEIDAIVAVVPEPSLLLLLIGGLFGLGVARRR